MSDSESVSGWIEQLKAGEETAATKLWNRCYARLTRVASQKLREAAPRVVDEDDVVLSAFDTFFRRAQQGRFPHLHDRDELWQLLVTITERKALNQLRYQSRQKRDAARVRSESVLLPRHGAGQGGGMDEIAGPEPTPEFAAIMAEQFDRLLHLLSDDELRHIALLKLEGCSNAEIAARIDRSICTVERRLRLIRNTWKKEHLE